MKYEEGTDYRIVSKEWDDIHSLFFYTETLEVEFTFSSTVTICNNGFRIAYLFTEDKEILYNFIFPNFLPELENTREIFSNFYVL